MAKETWLWLVSGLGFGAVNTAEVLEAYPGGAEAVYHDLGSEKLDDILTQKQAEKLAATRPEDYALSLAHAESQGIYALPYDDKMYPDMLRSITTPPLLLFVKGDLSLLNGQLSVGMVGARRPSGYGVEAVKTIGRGVALGGAIIVSGLAAGLDSEAHKAALAVNGPTIACIAFGHDNCYPAQNKKLMEVIERYGAVVSEYPLGTKPEKPYFLHRNRLIAGLSHALVVAEARKHSGTMSTVNFATDYGRDVFAVPGSIFSELSSGTNAMIRDGAYLAATAADIMSMYGIELPEEDLTKAAAAQAQEGRPEMASATPPWRQVEPRRQPPRHMEHQDLLPDDISPADIKAGEQTLLEALQSQLDKTSAPGGGDRVSRGAAIDAFRKLQNNLPPTADTEIDARNRALDEMVAAVSDDVDIGRAPKKPKPPKNRSERQKEMQRLLAEQADSKIKPFKWDSAPRLSKAEVAKSEREAEEKRKNRRGNTLAYPVPGGELNGTPLAPLSPVAPVAPVRVASAVNPVNVMPPQPAPTGAERAARRQAQRREAVMAGPHPGAQARPTEKVVIPDIDLNGHKKPAPVPEAEPKKKKPTARPPAPKQEGRSFLDTLRGGPDDDLSGKLRTLQKHPEGRASSTFEHAAPKQDDAGTYRPTAGVGGIAGAPAKVAPVAVPPAAPPPQVNAAGVPQLRTQPVRSLDEEQQEALRRLEREVPPAPQAPPPREVLPPSSQYSFPSEDLAEGEALETVSDAARSAYEQLGVNPRTLAQISERSGLSSGEAMAALTELELAGLSRQLPGRQFVIMQ